MSSEVQATKVMWYNLLGFQSITFAFVFDLWLKARTGSFDNTMVNVVISLGVMMIIVGPAIMTLRKKWGEQDEQ